MADAWPFYVNMIVGIADIILVLTLGFQLLNDSIRPMDAFIIGVLASVVNHVVRHLGVIFGVHTLVTLVAVIGLCVLITRKGFWKTAAAAAAGLTTLASFQILELIIISRLVADYFELVVAHPWINILTMIPYDLLMLAMIYASKRYKLILFNSAYYEID